MSRGYTAVAGFLAVASYKTFFYTLLVLEKIPNHVMLVCSRTRGHSFEGELRLYRTVLYVGGGGYSYHA